MYLQGKKVGQFPLKAGDDAANICWMKLQADNCIITHMYISRFSYLSLSPFKLLSNLINSAC